MPAITLCARRWKWASDDMWLPSCLLIPVRVFFVFMLASAWEGMERAAADIAPEFLDTGVGSCWIEQLLVVTQGC